MIKGFPELQDKMILPNLDEKGEFTCWVYDSPGEPAFEFKFKFDQQLGVIDLTVTPMNMSGEPGKSVTTSAN